MSHMVYMFFFISTLNTKPNIKRSDGKIPSGNYQRNGETVQSVRCHSCMRTYIKSQGVAQHPWKPCIGGCVGGTGRSPKNIGSPLSHINDLQVH